LRPATSHANNEKSYIVLIHRILPICGVRIAAAMVLVQHEGQERIGQALNCIRSTSPIVTEVDG
jgi:hypothetical protein